AFDFDGFGVLISTAEKEVADAVGEGGAWCEVSTGAALHACVGARVCIGVGGADDECAGAIAEEAAEFSGDAAGDERAAVEGGGEDRYRACLARGDLRLSDRERVDETEAGAADVEGSTVFTGTDA